MLEHVGYIDLPPHAKPGGFDHAAAHRRTRRVYVAHTANDAVDVVDSVSGRLVGTVPGLPGVAGALVNEEQDLVFTSNRAENTIGVFPTSAPGSVAKVRVGLRPNGLAYDPARHRLLAANVGDATIPHSFTVSIVDVRTRTMVGDCPVPGRTRWTVYDPAADVFHVNISEPPLIAVIDASDPLGTMRLVAVPSAGPHGLDIDVTARRLFCACDGGRLVELDADRGVILRGA